MYAFHHVVRNLAMRGVAPPDEHVEVVKHLLGQGVFGSSSVAVRTQTRSARFSEIPAAIVVCIPSG